MPNDNNVTARALKEIDLTATRTNMGISDPIDTVKADLKTVFEKDNPEMELEIEDLALEGGNLRVDAKVSGTYAVPLDFKPVAVAALEKALYDLHVNKPELKAAGPEALTNAIAASSTNVAEREKVDDEAGIIWAVPPGAGEGAAPADAAGVAAKVKAAPPAGKIQKIPITGTGKKETPPANSFHQCPFGGTGTESTQNSLKNRIDSPSGTWNPVAISDLVDLAFPAPLPRQRSGWTAPEITSITVNEGWPIQVEGWLVGARAEGPESCNCHLADNADVDYHLWLVDDLNQVKQHDRSRALVCEVSPRMRAKNPTWDITKIAAVAQALTKVRISGWLMMDPEHPDQIGKTRGTIWELHPIIKFEVEHGNAWAAL